MVPGHKYIAILDLDHTTVHTDNTLTVNVSFSILKPLRFLCLGSIKNSLLSLFYIFPSPPPLVDEKWAAHDCTVMKMYTGTGVYRPVHFGSLQ